MFACWTDLRAELNNLRPLGYPTRYYLTLGWELAVVWMLSISVCSDPTLSGWVRRGGSRGRYRPGDWSSATRASPPDPIEYIQCIVSAYLIGWTPTPSLGPPISESPPLPLFPEPPGQSIVQIGFFSDIRFLLKRRQLSGRTTAAFLYTVIAGIMYVVVLVVLHTIRKGQQCGTWELSLRSRDGLEKEQVGEEGLLSESWKSNIDQFAFKPLHLKVDIFKG